MHLMRSRLEGIFRRNCMVFLGPQWNNTFTFLTVYAVLVCVQFCILLKDTVILDAAIFFFLGGRTYTAKQHTAAKCVTGGTRVYDTPVLVLKSYFAWKGMLKEEQEGKVLLQATTNVMNVRVWSCLYVLFTFCVCFILGGNFWNAQRSEIDMCWACHDNLRVTLGMSACKQWYPDYHLGGFTHLILS